MSVSENLKIIKEEINEYNPTIIAVTKYYNESKIIEAYEAGIRDFGESRVIEALEKINKLPDNIKENSKFHLIGHLQTNKVKNAVGNFDLIHSIDSLKLAEEISKFAHAKNITQKILLQINNANEEQKYGFKKEEVFNNFQKIKALTNIEVVGLMNIAPFNATKEELKKLFNEIVEIKNKLEITYNCELKEISMGMSDDFKEACQSGSTMIRIGTKLFN